METRFGKAFWRIMRIIVAEGKAGHVEGLSVHFAINGTTRISLILHGDTSQAPTMRFTNTDKEEIP